jgi:hypothetical protein
MVAAGLGGWAVACSSIESMSFSDGTCVGSGCEQTTAAGSGSSSSGTCAVDAGCAVSWKTDIFAGMLDVSTGANCTGALCHGGGIGNLTLSPGMPAAAYTAVTTFSLVGGQAYIVPCDKAGSGMLCNMKTDADAGADAGTNPFGTCGSQMPLSGATDLTPDQIDKIATWIACGAPNN